MAHAELFEAEPTAWCIVHEPEFFGPSVAPGAAKVGPRAAIFENGMGDADELLFVTEGDDALPVLKPDRARGLEARYADANELVEEDASIRVASALWHESKATLGLRHHLCGIIIPQAIAATICARSGARRNVG
jgi:hypothetical protein